MRGHAGEPTHVVVLATLGAPQRTRLGRRRGRPSSAPPQPPPAPVATGRATLIAAQPFAGAGEAERWLERVDAESEIAAALAVLNHLLHLHRTATADAAVREVARGQALLARVGVGAGEQVAEGRWTRALDVPAPAPPRRSAALRSQERLSALLSGRDAALACEELALRARADLAGGRQREAALQLRIALAAALRELAPWAPRGDLRTRIDELRGLQPAVEAAAATALEGGLDDAALAAVEHALRRLEAALRARTTVGFD
ncbi:MAG: hypothetical protein QOH72_570 [Solirubrobacteraceae bacterium]|nr:hypothetical protein [Solirubrobacteraceae bacterium]